MKRIKVIYLLLIIMMVLQGYKSSIIVKKQTVLKEAEEIEKAIISNELTIIEPIDLSHINNNNDEHSVEVSYNANKIMKYPIHSRYKKFKDEFCYELVIAESDEENISLREVKVIVSRINGEGIYDLEQVLINNNHSGYAWDSEGLYLADVNFDGSLDIIIENGHFGAQGSLAYSTYLWEGDRYVNSESFSNIPNAAIDEKNQYILGSWRNNAASHSHAMYTHINGEYMLSKVLEIRWGIEEDKESSVEEYYIAEYILTELLDGTEISTEVYSVGEYSREELERKFCSDESEWALLSGKWKQLSYRE